MSDKRNFLTRITMPRITNSSELARYVLLVNVFALAVALAVDVTQQLLFFTTWSAAIRSWTVTVFAVAVIATPVAMVFARAQRELQLTQQALERLSRTDQLTGLANRRALMEAGDARPPQGMVLVIADIDHFKTVNDTHGHRAGDAVLQAVAGIMTKQLAGYGLVGRLGGEEFALVSSKGSVDEILTALDELQRTIARTPIVTPTGAVQVTISAGVATGPRSGTFDKLYSDADEALYLAKSSGRNRISLSPDATEMLRKVGSHPILG